MPIAARLLSTFIKLQNLTNNYLSIQISNIIVGSFSLFLLFFSCSYYYYFYFV